jgi:hypothetical protein
MARDIRREPDATVLARLLRAPAERDLPAGRRLILKEHLMQEFTRVRNAAPAPGRRRRGPRPVLLTAATVAVVVAVSLIAVALGRPGGAAGPGPAAGTVQPAGTPAAQLLDKIAYAASRQPSQNVRDGQYEYVKSLEQYQVQVTRNDKSTFHMPKPSIRLFWQSVSNLCRPGLMFESGAYTPLTDQGNAKCPDEGTLQEPTYRLLQSLSTNPHTVLQQIYAVDLGLLGPHPGPSPYAPGQSKYSYAFDSIGNILNDAIVPPQASATLYRAAALIPGVTVVPGAVNAAGQHGVAVSMVYSGEREEWIFDKTTLLSIGERDVDAKTGHLVGTNAILARAFVDRAGQVPAARG